MQTSILKKVKLDLKHTRLKTLLFSALTFLLLFPSELQCATRDEPGISGMPQSSRSMPTGISRGNIQSLILLLNITINSNPFTYITTYKLTIYKKN